LVGCEVVLCEVFCQGHDGERTMSEP
jgi:hypothetical protein